MVTELGIGAMDTPQAADGLETLVVALKSGINFIDTAREYQGSEYLVGEAIRTVDARDVYLASKTFKRTRDGSQYDVDRSRQVLGVDKVHLYQLHDVSSFEVWEEVMQGGGALEGLKIARLRGLVDHIGVSSHSMDVLEEAIGSGEFDTVMLEYSAFAPETEELIRGANNANIGVIAMRPLGGSGRMSSIRTRIAEGDSSLTPASLLRFVLSNPHVSVAIPGSRFPDRVHDNVALASSYEPFSQSERRGCEDQAGLLYKQ